MQLLKKLFGIKSKAEKEQLKKEWDQMKLNLKEKVSGLTQPAVHLVKTEGKTNSKFGGKPIVNNHEFSWPRSNGKPMCFLAQIDLYEISQQLEYEWLNNQGSVLFFYDVGEMPWGFDPKDKGKWQVIYQEAASIEIGYPHDLEQETIIKETNIEFTRIELLPSFEDGSIRSLNLTDEETDLYIEIEEHYEEFDAFANRPAHQVGGIPLPVQCDVMQFEAQQASNGIYMGNAKGYKNADENDFQLAKEKWELLFQFDSDERLDVMWGDCGMIYFWVERDKSRYNNFNDTWLILQCT